MRKIQRTWPSERRKGIWLERSFGAAVREGVYERVVRDLGATTFVPRPHSLPKLSVLDHGISICRSSGREWNITRMSYKFCCSRMRE